MISRSIVRPRIHVDFHSKIVVALAAAFSLLAFNPSAAQQSSMPDVIVLVLPASTPLDMLSVTYNSSVDMPQVKTDLAALAKHGNWELKSPTVTTDGSPPSTAVDFQVDHAIYLTTGSLPIEPFILAFKRYKHIQLSFLLPESFPFRSLRDYSDRFVDIKWSTQNDSVTYNITVKDNGFEQLNLPKIVLPPQEGTSNNTQTTSQGRGISIWLALLVAVAAGAVVLMTLSRINRKRKES